MTTLGITINRDSNSMATSFLVWAKYRAFPQTDGDGTFVGEIEIDADETSVSYSWTSPNGSTNWKFIAAAKYMDQVGVFGQLESV